jgi:hypothetical protein
MLGILVSLPDEIIPYSWPGFAFLGGNVSEKNQAGDEHCWFWVPGEFKRVAFGDQDINFQICRCQEIILNWKWLL